MSFEEWYFDEYGEMPDIDDECVADMMAAFCAGLESADAYFSTADMFDIEDAMLDELGL